MMLGGDELSMTQSGNNNAYCQDNALSWLNWSLDKRQADFLSFVRNAIALRNSHQALRPFRYVESEIPVPHEPGIVSWRDADGSELMPGPWGRQEPRVLMLTIEPTDHPTNERQETLLVLFNASNEDAKFRIPRIGKHRRTEWSVALDTSSSDGLSNAVLRGGRETLIPSCSLMVAVSR
jgi:glycogen operon protein